MNAKALSLGLIVILALVSVGSSIKCYQCINNECPTPDVKKTTSSPTPTPSAENGTTVAAESNANSGNRTARSVTNSTETSDPSYDTVSDTSSCDCGDVSTLTSFDCDEEYNACVFSKTFARNQKNEILGQVIRRQCGKLEESKKENCETSEGFNGDSTTCYCKSDDCNSVNGLQASWMIVLSVVAVFFSLRN